MNLAEKTIIVTGGARGIGKEIAAHFLRTGRRVVVADIVAPAMPEISPTPVASPENFLFVKTDVGDEAAVQNLVARTLEKFGRIDVLVNNAGIASPVSGAIENLALADWERVLRTNLTGMFLCAKHCVPALRQTRGAIVNIASTRALQSEPHTEAYAASKGGAVALTHALAVSLGPDVRVNCISPGWIAADAAGTGALRPEDHRQHPCGRVGEPRDIAEAVAFLVSDGAGFITGQNLVIDGGMTRKMIYAE